MKKIFSLFRSLCLLINYLFAKNNKVNKIQILAITGDAEAQNNLGNMYKNGQGVMQSDTKALEWYSKAAHQGYAEAQYAIGVMYKNGQGVA